MSIIRRILERPREEFKAGLNVLPSSIDAFLDELRLYYDVRVASSRLCAVQLTYKTADPPARARLLSKEFPKAMADLHLAVKRMAFYKEPGPVVGHKQ